MKREREMDDELKKKNGVGEDEYVRAQQSVQVHVVMLAFPIVGRTNPMVEFAKRLSSKPGILVTLATTAALAQGLHSSPSGYGTLTISTLDDYTDGFTSAGSDNLDDYTDRFARLAPLALSQLIANLNNVRCLIYDSSQIWALPFARQLGLFAAPFFPQSCAVSLIFRHVFKGVLSAPPSCPPHHTRDDGLVVAPALPPMSLGDFPSFVQQLGRFPLLEKLVLSQFHNFDDADWQFFNTFDALEEEVVKWMRKQWPSFKTIGPTIPGPTAVDMNSEEAADSACIQWLDTQADGSTLYVSFGSLADLGEAQMEELASALTNSGKPFLWVVSSSQETKLPKGFKDDLLVDRGEGEAKVKGLVVKWCPQLAVLAHRAVGCFFTHCGWNSTLEAISSGVPLVAMPQWADQPTNAMFVHQVWRVGIRVKPDPAAAGLVTRDQIQACIREVMEGQTGQELRYNATKLMLQAKAAMHQGGTSDRNVDDFVAKLLSPN